MGIQCLVQLVKRPLDPAGMLSLGAGHLSVSCVELAAAVRHNAPMKRLTYLDLLRGLCAVSVLIVHYRWFYSIGSTDFGDALDHNLPLADLLMPFYLRGGWAVQAFWVLSGAIFYIRYSEQGRQIDGAKFFVWRFARLYPLHFATLLLVAAIQAVSVWTFGEPKVYFENTPQAFVLQIFFAAHWFDPSQASFNAPIWSVSIEILSYALFFVVLRLAGARIAAFFVMFVALTVFARLTGSVIILCGSLYFLGCLTGFLFLKFPTRILLLGGGLASAAGILAMIVLGVKSTIFFYTVLPGLMTITLGLDKGTRPLPRSVAWLGDVTYSTYLCHMPILMLVKFWLDQRADAFTILSSPLSLAAWIGGVVAISAVVYRRFELPAQRRIRSGYIRFMEARQPARI